MQYALIKNNLVEKVVVVEPELLYLVSDGWDHIEAIDTLLEQELHVGLGWGWDGTQFIAPPPPPPPPPEPPKPYEWFIDIGPFYDRFGAAKMAVLTSTDAGLKAILSDLSIRKWIDLQRPDVAQALAYVGSVVPAVTAALQTQILTTPVSEFENLALRKLYFS